MGDYENGFRHCTFSGDAVHTCCLVTLLMTHPYWHSVHVVCIHVALYILLRMRV